MRPIVIAALLLAAPVAAGLPLAAEDDAGSGGDAGATLPFAIHVERAVVYEGNATPLLDEDLYVFDGAAGERVLLWVEGVGVCADLLTPEGGYDQGICDDTAASPGYILFALHHDGVQRLRVSSLGSASYRFALDLAMDRFLHDDAGTGRDAPDFPIDLIVVEPGIGYSGRTDTLDQDWYAFDASPGVQRTFVITGGLACLDLVDFESGERIAWSCAQPDASGTFTWTAPDARRYLMDVSGPAPEAYGFGMDIPASMLDAQLTLDLESHEQPARGDDPTCGTGAPVTATSGEGAELDGLVFAALKTGFRAVVAWSTAEPVAASLAYSLDAGEASMVAEPTPRLQHVFVLDGLPEGATLCFTPSAGEAHAIRLANAMTDIDPDTGVYTANLLLVANTQITQRADLEGSLPRFARILHDMTDGHVRAGKLILVYADLEKHHSGVESCYGLVVVRGPGCSHAMDVVYTYDSCAGGSACTTLLGVKDAHYHVWMSSVWQSNAVAPIDDSGAVLAHEMGHYLLGALDVYGALLSGNDCWDPALGLSIMGGGRDATELDDATSRCPNEVFLQEYVPSWTLFRAAYPTVPERSAIDAGPQGDGEAYSLHVFETLPGLDLPVGDVADTDDDAGTGADAADELAGALLVQPRTVYDGRALATDVDHYAFEARAGQAFDLATRGAICGTIVDAQDQLQEADCASGVVTHTRWIVPADGVWYLRFELEDPAYRFAFGLDQPASVPVV